ncbi:hypothetical protein ACN20G_27520 (plasmid) [Streptomyces sp. BI20]|uniref:hypothetical protein n=1 Tax=Streptomyces sp. BI20 TaxID=3403460 RepID=UPI003C763F28
MSTENTHGARTPHEIDASGLPMPRAQDLILRELRTLTDRAEPFTAVLFLPAPPERPDRPEHPDRPEPVTTAGDRVRALKALRPALTAHCRGLAFVAPADISPERARGVHSGENLWGCPTSAGQDPTAARAWAVARARGERDAPGTTGA